MQSRDFCYWLQGYFEINGVNRQILSLDQIDVVKKHLALVFVHEIDPSMGSAEHQGKLNSIHAGPTIPGNPVMRC